MIVIDLRIAYAMFSDIFGVSCLTEAGESASFSSTSIIEIF